MGAGGRLLLRPVDRQAEQLGAHDYNGRLRLRWRLTLFSFFVQPFLSLFTCDALNACLDMCAAPYSQKMIAPRPSL